MNGAGPGGINGAGAGGINGAGPGGVNGTGPGGISQPPAVPSPVPDRPIEAPDVQLGEGISVHRKGDKLVFTLPDGPAAPKIIRLFVLAKGQRPEMLSPTKRPVWEWPLSDKYKNLDTIRVECSTDDGTGTKWKKIENYKWQDLRIRP